MESGTLEHNEEWEQSETCQPIGTSGTTDIYWHILEQENVDGNILHREAVEHTGTLDHISEVRIKATTREDPWNDKLRNH